MNERTGVVGRRGKRGGGNRQGGSESTQNVPYTHVNLSKNQFNKS